MTSFINFPFFTIILIFSFSSSLPPASVIAVVVVVVIVVCKCRRCYTIDIPQERFCLIDPNYTVFSFHWKHNAGIMGIQHDENNKKMMMMMMTLMMMRIKFPICLIDYLNHCSGSPCANGGSCSNLADGYKCNCIKGQFTGKLCEQGKTTTYLV